jgi:ribonuclease VapC
VIVIDTSALMAILLDEPPAQAMLDAIDDADAVCISAGTLAECYIVARGKNVHDEMRRLLAGIAPAVVDVDPLTADQIGEAYGRFGKGFHPARLNFGDMFSYAAARILDAPLLFVGEDFAATDLRPALA